LLIRHAKYSAMLSKIHYYRLLFRDFAHWEVIGRRSGALIIISDATQGRWLRFELGSFDYKMVILPITSYLLVILVNLFM